MDVSPKSENNRSARGASPNFAPPAAAGRVAYRARLHWHVFLVHFPIAAFVGSFGFMTLHIVTQDSCFQLAAYATLIAGTAIMIPTIISGWKTWKNHYQGVRGKLFLTKIRVSFAMLATSLILVTYQTLFHIELLDISRRIDHALYFFGMTLLMFGALAEGYYGGRLNHR